MQSDTAHESSQSPSLACANAPELAEVSPGLAGRRWVMLLLFFMAMFGLHWAMVVRVARDFPDVIGRDAGLAIFLSQWHEQGWSWARLFERFDGQWQVFGLLWQSLGYTLNQHVWSVPLFSLTAGVVMAMAMTLLVGVVADWRQRLAAWTVAMVAMLSFACQASWMNSLDGLDVSFAWAMGFQILACVFWLTKRPLTWPWGLGFVMALAGGLSLASGMAVAMPVGLVLMKRATRTQKRRDLYAAMVVLVLGVAGVVQMAMHHNGLAWPIEEDGLSWLLKGLLALGFPWLGWPGMLGVMWLPWIWLATQWWRQPADVDADQRDLWMTLGAWVLLDQLMRALSAGSSPVIDSLASLWLVGVVVNTACLMHWLVRVNVKFNWCTPIGKPGLAMLWLAMLCLGCWQMSGQTQDADRKKQMLNLQGRALLGYQITDDPDVVGQVLERADWMERSQRDAIRQQLLAMVHRPGVLAIWPEAMKPALQPVQVSGQGRFIAPDPQLSGLPVQSGGRWLGVTPAEPAAEPSQLTLTYTRPETHHYWRLTSRLSIREWRDVQLRMETPQDVWMLLDPARNRPASEIIRAASRGGMIQEQHVFPLDSSAVTLKASVSRQGSQVGLAFGPPIRAGLAEYGLHRIQPLALWLFQLGLGGLLGVGWWMALGRQRHPQDMIEPRWHSNWPIMVATLLAGVLVLFMRKSDAFLNPQFWAEDGVVFFYQQHTQGSWALLAPQNGYLVLLSRLIAWISDGVVPYRWTPHFYNYAALAITCGAMGLMFSPRLPWAMWQKSAMALAMVGVAHFHGEVFMNVTNIQWMTAMLLVVLLCKQTPSPAYGLLGRQWAMDLSLLVWVGLTGPFVIFAWPMYGLNAWLKRTRHALVLWLVASACCAAHGWFMLSQPEQEHFELMPWPMSQLVAELASQKVWEGGVMMAWRTLAHWPVLGCVMLALLVAWLLVNAKPHRAVFWQMVYILGMVSVMLAAMVVRQKTSIAWQLDDPAARYAYLPILGLAWVLILLLGVVEGWRRWLACGLLGFMLATSLGRGFVSPAWPDTDWRQAARQLEAGQPTVIRVHPLPLGMQVHVNDRAEDSRGEF